jgi:hypothetical protein
MRSRASERSVAATMRPTPLRLTAAVGAAAAVLAVSPPAFAADAVYGGVADSGDPIVVKADAKAAKLRSIAISWRAVCADDSAFPGRGELTPVTPVAGFSPGPTELLVSRNAKGRFKGTQLAAMSASAARAAIIVTVAGKLTATRATGTLSAAVKIMDSATGADITSCDTGSIRWSATRAPGVIYGGVTSQDEPMVLRLNNRRKRVNDVLTVWRAPCAASGGYYRAPDRFTGFPVKSTGRFGGPFTSDSPMDVGGSRHVDYSVLGRIIKTTAKGTLQVKVAETDAGGAVTDTCDTGGVTWKAATG